MYSGFLLPHAAIAPATTEQALALADRMPLLADRPARDNRTTTYLCENFTCQQPVVGVDNLITALGKLGNGPAPDPSS